LKAKFFAAADGTQVPLWRTRTTAIGVYRLLKGFDLVSR
jgi:hypothetical protein